MHTGEVVSGLILQLDHDTGDQVPIQVSCERMGSKSVARLWGSTRTSIISHSCPFLQPFFCEACLFTKQRTNFYVTARAYTVVCVFEYTG